MANSAPPIADVSSASRTLSIRQPGVPLARLLECAPVPVGQLAPFACQLVPFKSPEPPPCTKADASTPSAIGTGRFRCTVTWLPMLALL